MKRLQAYAAFVLLSVFISFVLGCGTPCNQPGSSLPGADSQTEERDYDIVGYVRQKSTSNRGGDVLGTILVEGEEAGAGVFDKASITVTKKTEVLRQLGNGFEKADFDRLAEGHRVGVRFTGPVAESYPVMAKAGKIVILPVIMKSK